MPKLVYFGGERIVKPFFIALHNGPTTGRYFKVYNDDYTERPVSAGTINPVLVHSSKTDNALIITYSPQQVGFSYEPRLIRSSLTSNSWGSGTVIAPAGTSNSRKMGIAGGVASVSSNLRIMKLDYGIGDATPIEYTPLPTSYPSGNFWGTKLINPSYEGFTLRNGTSRRFGAGNSTAYLRYNLKTYSEQGVGTGNIICEQPSPNHNGSLVMGVVLDITSPPATRNGYGIFNSSGGLISTRTQTINYSTNQLVGGMWHPSLDHVFFYDNVFGRISRSNSALSDIDVFIPPSGYDAVYGMDVSENNLIVVWGQTSGPNRLLQVIRLSDHNIEFSLQDDGWFGAVQFLYGL